MFEAKIDDTFCPGMLVMAALRSRCRHSILPLWLLSFFFLFFLAYSQRSQIGCLPYFHTWCGLSPNLECRSKMFPTWLAENTGCKNYAKNCHSAHHRTTLLGYIFVTKACINNRKKTLNGRMSSTCPHHMANIGPLTAEIGWWVWGTPANFNGFLSWLRYCTDVAQWRPATLCTMFGISWAGTRSIHFWALLSPNGILPGATFLSVYGS